MVVLFDPCNETFLSNNGRGSISSGYNPIEAATCVFWSNNTWHILNIFVGLHAAERCPPLNQCNSSKTLSWHWMNGMLPVSKGIEYKKFCEINATGCCENNTMMKISDCLPVSVYFIRNSTGCVEAYCYVNEPDVNHNLGTNMSSVELVNKRNETNQCANTSSARISIWLICLIALLVASNVFLIFYIVYIRFKVQRKTHVVEGNAKTHADVDKAETHTDDTNVKTHADDDKARLRIKPRKDRIKTDS